MDLLDELNMMADQAILSDESGKLDSRVRSWILEAQSRDAGTARGLLSDGEYLFQLSEIIDSPRSIQQIAALDRVPPILESMPIYKGHSLTTEDGDDEHRSAKFVLLDGTSMMRVLAHAESKGSRATYIPLSRARKEYCATGLLPTLNYDTTLPHHRQTHWSTYSTAAPALPETYPILYFFYGTLTEKTRLRDLTGVDSPFLQPAHVVGAKLGTTLGGRYLGMINSYDPGDRVDGQAFWVPNAEAEKSLRGYEGRAYEIVRCEIFVSEWSTPCWGRTFRFRDKDRPIIRR